VTTINSTVDTTSTEHKANREAMLEKLAEIDGEHAKAVAGGGDKYVERHRKRGKLLVRERIELLLVDRDFRVQAAAIEALAIIADPAAIPALRRMIDRELDGRLRRRGKEVIRDLEDGASAGEDLRRMRDEIGELRSLAGTLRERVELLEARTGDHRVAAVTASGKATPGARAKVTANGKASTAKTRSRRKRPKQR
jgi:HEAT repeat protein